MATALKHVGAKSKMYNIYNSAFVGADCVCFLCYYHALDKYCKGDHIKRTWNGRTEHTVRMANKMPLHKLIQNLKKNRCMTKRCLNYTSVTLNMSFLFLCKTLNLLEMCPYFTIITQSY
jgi:hypothetical protein